MASIEMPSGKKAVINMAPYGDSMRLSCAVLREFAREGLTEGDLAKVLRSFRGGDVDFDPAPLLRGAVAAITSDSVHQALWACLSRCTYGGEKIVPLSFEDEVARGDFLPIALECGKVNILPFLQPQISKLSGIKNILT